MTIEDLNKASDYTPPTKDEQLRYAWYTNDVTEENLKDVKIDEKVYTARRHTKTFVHQIDRPRFYTWDDEKGITHTSSKVNEYKDDISNTKPILVSRTYYCYNPGYTIINNILGGDNEHRGWLASSYVYSYKNIEYVHFGMYFARSGIVDGFSLYDSNDNIGIPSYGIRPVIQFSINRLDVSDTTKTGTESAPWEIK